ncbi:DoxX family protein [Ferruginibacter sp. SUN002]|uniref:DoxX family protein n=1 Tax=Ferruginibacter sp. SUN002 TaxID=2937789 RepID=UPI003D364184
MNLVHRLEIWGDRHHPKWLDVIRIVLGIFLLYKGIDFLRNTSQLVSVMTGKSQFNSFWALLFSHYIVFAHIVGGVLMVLGFLTRLACLIQIPILLGALIFVHAHEDIFRTYSEIFVTLIVLLLLVYFLIIGNGPLSIKIKEEERPKYKGGQ